MPRRRTYAELGFRVTRHRLVLREEAYRRLAHRAKTRGLDLSVVMETAIEGFIDTHREWYPLPEAGAAERPGVYYDAQGREHEEADVR